MLEIVDKHKSNVFIIINYTNRGLNVIKQFEIIIYIKIIILYYDLLILLREWFIHSLFLPKIFVIFFGKNA